MSGVWPLRMPLHEESAFPADCLHRPIFTADQETGEYGSDTQGFQHMAGFIYVTTTGPRYSYGRRLLALRFRASAPPEGGT
jgi:hypothetical protein